MPQRIQRSRKAKQTSPNGLPILYVGRPTRYGNPYKVQPSATGWAVTYEGRLLAEYTTKAQAAAAAVEQYAAWVQERQLDLRPLKGKNLSCWCSLTEPCHADVLLALANNTNVPQHVENNSSHW